MVALARTKLKELSADDITAIEAVSDQRVLTELITSLGQARSVRKVRAALDRARARQGAGDDRRQGDEPADDRGPL